MKLRVVDGDRNRKPRESPKVLRVNLRCIFASLRPLIFAFAFTGAAIVIDANPVLVGESAAGILPIVCIFAAWFMTCAIARASLILGVAVLLACGACLLYLPESQYAPVMLQGHVVAATIGLIFGAFASGWSVEPAPAPDVEPCQHPVLRR